MGQRTTCKDNLVHFMSSGIHSHVPCLALNPTCTSLHISYLSWWAVYMCYLASMP